MKNRVFLILSILQLLIGLVLVVSFVVVAIGGIDVTPYISTLVIAVFFVVMGIVSLVKWKKKN
ncbi:MAG: hypothetical protein IKU25_01330 [Clostridia bacterium]|nr:hypothetical protein [Clostridia bacterium]